MRRWPPQFAEKRAEQASNPTRKVREPGPGSRTLASCRRHVESRLITQACAHAPSVSKYLPVVRIRRNSVSPTELGMCAATAARSLRFRIFSFRWMNGIPVARPVRNAAGRTAETAGLPKQSATVASPVANQSGHSLPEELKLRSSSASRAVRRRFPLRRNGCSPTFAEAHAPRQVAEGSVRRIPQPPKVPKRISHITR